MPIYLVQWQSIIAAETPLEAALRAYIRIAHMSKVPSPVGYEPSSVFEVSDPTAEKAWSIDVEHGACLEV